MTINIVAFNKTSSLKIEQTVAPNNKNRWGGFFECVFFGWCLCGGGGVVGEDLCYVCRTHTA